MSELLFETTGGIATITLNRPDSGNAFTLEMLADWEKALRTCIADDAIRAVVLTGAGMDMALMGDLRFAAESARFAESYIKVGFVAGDGGAWMLPRLIGTPKALEMLWTGDFVSAPEAERIGLVNRVVPDAELMTATYALAERLANGPTVAIRLMKRMVQQGANSGFREALDFAASCAAIAASTEDHKEATAAFAEKRKPVFKGR